jgi:5-methylcytosine-specific restriction endonuclease McrA
MLSCELCNHTFTRQQSLDRHNASKMHLNRSKSGVKKYTCGCGKYFLHQNSVRNHKMKCTFKEVVGIQQAPLPSPPLQEPSPQDVQQMEFQTKAEQQMKDMKLGFEKEMKELKECFEEEIRKLNVRPEKMPEKRNSTMITPQDKSRDKRKKISKEVRHQIVEKQGKICGECKLSLTPYFQIDHMIGLQFGGTDHESNLMALCCECHAMKSFAENQCREEIKGAIQTILHAHVMENGSLRSPKYPI